MSVKRAEALVAILALLAMHHLCVAEDVKQNSYYEQDYHKGPEHHGPYDTYGDGYESDQYPGYHSHGSLKAIPAPKVTDISPNGQSLSELAAIFWQWALRFDPATSGSPLNATTPLDCNLGIVGDGDVLVIGGLVSNTFADVNYVTDPPRECHLSKDIKAIFIPLLNAESDTDVDQGELNQPGGWLRNNSIPNGRLKEITTSVYLHVKSHGDYVHIPGWPHRPEHQTEFIKDNYYVVTPMFPLAGPRYSTTEYTGPLLAASTGYYVLLDVRHVHFPLQLKFGGALDFKPLGAEGGFKLDITYNIYKP